MSEPIPDDPHEWSQANIDAFAAEAEPDDLERVLLELVRKPDERGLGVLAGFLNARHVNTYLKPMPSQLALRAILSLGPPGVSFLMAQMARHDVRYISTVLGVLWNVARGRGLVNLMDFRVPPNLSRLQLPVGTEEAALRAVRDLFQEARTDLRAFSRVASFLYMDAVRDAFSKEASADIPVLMSLFAEGTVKLTRSVLDEFAQLIAAESVEERYQEFLTKHPALIEPLAAEVVPKQRLGTELATDFAVRGHDDRWVLVEIERPQDDLFTGKNDFRERFTHAFGQVLDFQSWVDDNVAYAQKHMKLISAPRGALIMGLRSRLTPFQQMKLRRFADNSRRIDVYTYDDLLARGRSLYHNLISAQV